MLKYTRAMILRTGMQIEQAVRLAQTVSLFTAILPPLCQILTQKGVFLRNLILLLCGLGFAIFTLIANANSKITKKERKEAKKIVEALKFVANLYALFVLGYGIYCANEAPSFLSLLSLVPIAFSVVIYIVMIIVRKIINAQLELFIDAVEMDFKPVIETWQKTRRFIHTVANDGVEIDTSIHVSKENQQILEEAAIVFEGESAKKKAKKKIEKKKKQEANAKLARAFVKGLFTYKKRSAEQAALVYEEPTPQEEIVEAIEEPVAQIEAPCAKRKSPFGFLTEKKKKAIEQLPEASEEKTPEEALPKA